MTTATSPISPFNRSYHVKWIDTDCKKRLQVCNGHRPVKLTLNTVFSQPDVRDIQKASEASSWNVFLSNQVAFYFDMIAFPSYLKL